MTFKELRKIVTPLYNSQEQVITNDEDNCMDAHTCEKFSNAKEGLDGKTNCRLRPGSEYCRIDDSNDC